MKKYDIELNKHKLQLIVDTDNNHWYVLFPKYAQYVSGEINQDFERIHHPITVGSRQYSLVFDCDDTNTYWESYSVFDEKKQTYIDTAQGEL